MPSSKDKPSQKLPARGSRRTVDGVTPIAFVPGQSMRDTQWTEDDLLAEDDPLASNPPRASTSAIRLNNPTTERRSIREVNMGAGTTRQNPNVPPRKTQGQIPSPLPGPMQPRSGRSTTEQQVFMPARKERLPRNVHWLVYMGIGMIAALALFVVGSAVVSWTTNKYNDITYGYPRTYQTDAVVGHGDSPQHESHFIAMNLHGQVIVIELPGGNPSKAIDYIGPDLIASGDDLIPVTLTFGDLNNDGKIDMVIHIQDNKIDFCRW
jgi:hypothetical protein